ncbi:MAG: hypothetical protein C0617_12690 [Desulfuromonas sp.]|uniref:hypothetical protein n=1 Tax=Desulfuromonas sp. TaxID=892 RepID=UPI000CB03A1F|nr:hypothetical protein [Desulfuromonas sp.]PLX83370.1 MAG: hypothetical protein C0617_12690 [Desulfuromonas sp.]
MDCSAHDFGNPYIAMGLFALYVVLVSLVRLLAEKEYFRLTAMKRVWGRSRGLAFHFISNVALPLVLGIVFFSRGVAGFGAIDLPHDRPILPKPTVTLAASSGVEDPLHAHPVAGPSPTDDTRQDPSFNLCP